MLVGAHFIGRPAELSLPVLFHFLQSLVGVVVADLDRVVLAVDVHAVLSAGVGPGRHEEVGRRRRRTRRLLLPHALLLRFGDLVHVGRHHHRGTLRFRRG